MLRGHRVASTPQRTTDRLCTSRSIGKVSFSRNRTNSARSSVLNPPARSATSRRIQFPTSITAKFDQVAVQFTAVAAELVSERGEFAKVEGNLTKEIAGLSTKIGELDSSFFERTPEQTRTLILMLAGFSVAVCATMVLSG